MRVTPYRLQIYGDLHRFFPVMAHRQGFRVTEIDVAQSHKDTHRRIYAPGLYVRRLLDLPTIFFLIKFTKKPLRFFGLVGTTLFGIGLATTLYLVVERLMFDVALADRPALHPEFTADSAWYPGYCNRSAGRNYYFHPC